MPRSSLVASLLLTGLLPLTGFALSLGDLTLGSALNEPLAAHIDLTADSGEELTEVTVQLAPAATFQRFGLDRPSFLDDLSFSLQQKGSKAQILVISSQPVSEPFVSLLLDVRWPQGRLLREYTLLLDPPSFRTPGSAEEPPVPATALAPVQPQIPPSTPAIQNPSVSPSVSAIRQTSAARESVDGAGATASDGASGAPSDPVTYGPVGAAETLWAIASGLAAGTKEWSTNQMMVALYAANPEAFGGNINRLLQGAILRVPERGAVSGTSNRSAATEVRRQDLEWRASPPAEPQAEPPVQPPARLQLVPPVEKPVAPSASLDRDSQKGLLPPQVNPPPGAEPSPEMAAAIPADGDSAGLAAALADKERLLSLKDNQLKVLQNRIRELEVKALIRAVPTQKTAPLSMVKQVTGVLSNSWVLLALAAVLLAVLFLVFGRQRAANAQAGGERFNPPDPREQFTDSGSGLAALGAEDGYSVEEVGAPRPGLLGIPVGRNAPFNGDAEMPFERTISTEGALELDQTDALAEADFHMAYGLYDQAAALISGALVLHPERRDLRMRLLEVLFSWENKAAFLSEAQILHRQLKGASDPDWNKVLIMGKQICPGETLFAGMISAGEALALDVVFEEEALPEGEALASDELTSDSWVGTALDSGPLAKGLGAPPDEGNPTVETRYSADSSPTLEFGTLSTTRLIETDVEAEETAQDLDLEEDREILAIDFDLTGLDEAVKDLGPVAEEGTLNLPALEQIQSGNYPPRQTSEDRVEQRITEDTAEQPRPGIAGLSDDSARLSEGLFVPAPTDDKELEPTFIMDVRRKGPEGPTMTEVGTKLDLARAYADMGDPDGARSILNEVLEEGDADQRQQARRMLDDLSG